MLSTTSNSTSLSPRSRSVQRAWPSGGAEQASATSFASPAPSSFRGLRLTCLRRSTADPFHGGGEPTRYPRRCVRHPPDPRLPAAGCARASGDAPPLSRSQSRTTPLAPPRSAAPGIASCLSFPWPASVCSFGQTVPPCSRAYATTPRNGRPKLAADVRLTCCLYTKTYYIWATMRASPTGMVGKRNSPNQQRRDTRSLSDLLRGAPG